MTPEQFLYWLKGYLVNCTTEEALEIERTLETVKVPEPNYGYTVTVSSPNVKTVLHD